MKISSTKFAFSLFTRRGSWLFFTASRAARPATNKTKTNMKTKMIKGCTVRYNSLTKLWDVLETRGGSYTGKVSFSGTLKEVRAALS